MNISPVNNNYRPVFKAVLVSSPVMSEAISDTVNINRPVRTHEILKELTDKDKYPEMVIDAIGSRLVRGVKQYGFVITDTETNKSALFAYDNAPFGSALSAICGNFFRPSSGKKTFNLKQIIEKVGIKNPEPTRTQRAAQEAAKEYTETVYIPHDSELNY